VLYIKAGAAKMAAAWFIHRPVWPVRPVRGLYRPISKNISSVTHAGLDILGKSNVFIFVILILFLSDFNKLLYYIILV